MSTNPTTLPLPTTLHHVSVTIRVVPDEDTQPSDFDCYDDEQIEAWRNDEWRFVGVIVTAEASAGMCAVTIEGPGLWGIDYDGSPDSIRYLREVASEEWLEVKASFPTLDDDAIDFDSMPIRWGV